MRLVVHLVQCVVFQLVLVSPTNNRNAVSSCTSKNVCDVIDKRTRDLPCYVKGKECSFNPKTCNYNCYTRVDKQPLLQGSPDTSRPRMVVLQCNEETKKWFHSTATGTVADCDSGKSVKIVKGTFHHVKRLNDFIYTLLKSSYEFMAMSIYFQRGDVYLPGFSQFMFDRYRQHTNWAHEIMRYINMRGGFVRLYDIPASTLIGLDNKAGLNGLERASDVSESIQKELYVITKRVTGKKEDPHLKHELKEFLDTSAKHLFQTNKLITTLKSYNDTDYSVGQYLVDQTFMEENVGLSHLGIESS